MKDEISGKGKVNTIAGASRKMCATAAVIRPLHVELLNLTNKT